MTSINEVPGRVISGVKPNLISVKYDVNNRASSIVPTKQCK